jgi:hypothetical protein
MKKIPKNKRITEIQYVYIIFKNSNTSENILEFFEEEVFIVKFFNMICRRSEPILKLKQFSDIPFEIVAALEPDEIIWDNLIFTKENQKIRNYILGLISVVFMAFAVITTVYIEAVDAWMGFTFPTDLCPT